MLFETTAEDIKEGTRHSCSSCPVALAIRRGMKLRSHVSILNVKVYQTTVQDEHLFCRLPNHIVNFIHDFDNGKQVEPVSFELDLV